MRFDLKNLGLMLACAGAAALSACSVDPVDIPASEYYARQFYKTFGTIAKDQDWTAATQGQLTVVTDRPTTVRIIAEVDSKTYLFGEYAGVEGERLISFDIPKSASDVRALVNGNEYRFTDGARLDFTSRSRVMSRALGGIDPDTHLGESGTYAGVDVEIGTNADGRKLTLEPDVAQEAIKHLEEMGTQIEKWSESNLDEVTDNFSVTADEFYLFPEFWNTSASARNIIGIYWEVSPGTEGAEEISVTNPNTGKTSTYYIVRVPFLQDPTAFLTPCKRDLVQYQTFAEIPGFDDIFATLCKEHPDTYCISDGSQKNQYGGAIESGKKIHRYSDGNWRELGSCVNNDWADKDNEVGKDLVAKFPDEFEFNQWGGLCHITLVDSPYDGTPNSSLVTNTDYYKSTGIHVKFSEPIRFGFYIQQENDVMYSQTKLNHWVEKLNDDGEPEWRQPSYVGTLTTGSDTEGNTRRHLAFEDWYGDNWDLNDMVFRIYGLDDTPNIPSITDEDEPGDPDPDEKEYDAYPWIIACEDLGATDDYDFNDIVFGVEHVAGTQFVYVTALAAGGTLPARLYYTIDGTKYQITGGTDDDFNSPKAHNQFTIKKSPAGGSTFEEWHKWFGNYDSSEMINTRDANVKIGATVRITLPEGKADQFSLSNEVKTAGWAEQSITHLGGFTVEVDQTNENGSVTTREIKAPFRSDNDADNIPQLFATTYKYNWPGERNSIYLTHAGHGNVIGTTPTGNDFATNSFMHWVNLGDVADFHNEAPSAPGLTRKHNWTGDVKVKESTDSNGKKVVTFTAYGNTYTFEATVDPSSY